MIAEISERLELGWRAVCTHSSEAHGASEQRAGFAFVDVAQLGEGELFAFAFEIGYLPGNELQ